MQNIVFILLIGIGATLMMDLWALLRQQLFGIAPTNWGMVGRWIGHMRKGRFFHTSIANADAVSGEKTIGWTAHYVIGIGYAVLLFLLFGEAWLLQPSAGPALALGIATVVAASKTPNPNAVRLHSVLNHAVFGIGLYLSALIVRFVL